MGTDEKLNMDSQDGQDKYQAAVKVYHRKAK